MVDPNWRIPVDESEIFSPVEVNSAEASGLLIKMLFGLVTFVMLGACGVFGIANLVGLDKVGWQESCGISGILILLRALDKATFGKK